MEDEDCYGFEEYSRSSFSDESSDYYQDVAGDSQLLAPSESSKPLPSTTKLKKGCVSNFIETKSSGEVGSE